MLNGDGCDRVGDSYSMMNTVVNHEPFGFNYYIYYSRELIDRVNFACVRPVSKALQ